jgi:cell division initiation protein
MPNDMELTPQRVRTVEFKTVRKGLDPNEVKSFLNEVADGLEYAQNQSTAMEARARAAVARLQAASAEPAVAGDDRTDLPADQADTISKTLLLAQRTADATVAEANVEAERVLAAANEESVTTLDSTREMAAQLIADARQQARHAGDEERAAVSSEVNSLLARRDFLESDVELLEQFLVEQRNRLREAASDITAVVERVPGGLGELRPPLMSASGAAVDTDIDESDGSGDVAAPSVAGAAEHDDDDGAEQGAELGDEDHDESPPAAGDGDDVEIATDDDGGSGQSDDDTPVGFSPPTVDEDSGGFTFRFDDDR